MVAPLGPPRRPLPAKGLPGWAWSPKKRFIRIYHAHPTRSGRAHRLYGPLNRFDQQIRDARQRPRIQPSGRGVIYLAENFGSALAEAFQGQGRVVEICPNMRAVPMAPASELMVLDITGDGIMKIGARAALASGHEPRRLTQRWGRAIYEDLPGFAGILYRSAHQNGRCVAGWETTGPLGFDLDEDRSLAGRSLWPRLVVALADQGREARRVRAADCNHCRRVGIARTIALT